MRMEATGETPDVLKLDGEHVKLQSVSIDGRKLSHNEYVIVDDALSIHNPPRNFTLEIETEVDPLGNKTLEGLYLAKGIFCTQCESEGFRRMTYFLDRPDVMTVYKTRIVADKAEVPVLLANGNLTSHGDLPNGKHFAVWEDPFPKPSYLFALVGGKLAHIEDKFVTMSGRTVTLRIFCEPGNEDRCTYAMDALKRSMRWDEEAFGREYDLDIFMIVAVSAFNFGAMENKGLNIFNDKLVFAKPETATDADYANIESVVAHEYFHNWTGNRITCRDWFQLCLKEGLTVFRDREFSRAMRSPTVERIGDVKVLRARQFPEDSGPLAHPVRPESYLTIDNFYTSTVYEKGAELCGMLKTVLGTDGFRKGMDLYFERHDGEAATVDQFVKCMEDANSADLSQFALWWSQAGTPRLDIKGRYDAAAQIYELSVAQSSAPTPGQPEKPAFHIPLKAALIDKDGKNVPMALEGEAPWSAPGERVLHVTRPKQVFRFTHVKDKPTPSLNRGFAAPIKLGFSYSPRERAFLMGRDTDLFNRWEAGQAYAIDLLLRMIASVRDGRPTKVDRAYLDAIGHVLDDAEKDKAFAALAVLPPTEQEVAQAMAIVEPEAIHTARETLVVAIAQAHRKRFAALYERLASDEPYSPDAVQAGRRALRNVSLRYLAVPKTPDAIAMVEKHFAAARNMTDMAAALSIISDIDAPARKTMFDAFYTRFADDPLVIDKWMTLQALSALPDTLDHVRALTRHSAYSMENPNRVRSLVHVFAMNNQLRFHSPDGAAYRFVADIALQLDRINPQVAARLLGSFETWRRFDPKRQDLIKLELERVREAPDLSRNLLEVASKTLAA
jgi:aminopeptidase N